MTIYEEIPESEWENYESIPRKVYDFESLRNLGKLVGDVRSFSVEGKKLKLEWKHEEIPTNINSGHRDYYLLTRMYIITR